MYTVVFMSKKTREITISLLGCDFHLEFRVLLGMVQWWICLNVIEFDYDTRALLFDALREKGKIIISTKKLLFSFFENNENIKDELVSRFDFGKL